MVRFNGGLAFRAVLAVDRADGIAEQLAGIVVGGNAALASERIGAEIGDREHRRYMGKDQGLVEPRAVRTTSRSWWVYLYSYGCVAESLITEGGGVHSTGRPDPAVSCIARLPVLEHRHSASTDVGPGSEKEEL
jgi:hypothetical protein